MTRTDQKVLDKLCRLDTKVNRDRKRMARLPRIITGTMDDKRELEAAETVRMTRLCDALGISTNQERNIKGIVTLRTRRLGRIVDYSMIARHLGHVKSCERDAQRCFH